MSISSPRKKFRPGKLLIVPISCCHYRCWGCHPGPPQVCFGSVVRPCPVLAASAGCRAVAARVAGGVRRSSPRGGPTACGCLRRGRTYRSIPCTRLVRGRCVCLAGSASGRSGRAVNRHAPGPVSYTHLDVYKRQPTKQACSALGADLFQGAQLARQQPLHRLAGLDALIVGRQFRPCLLYTSRCV